MSVTKELKQRHKQLGADLNAIRRERADLRAKLEPARAAFRDECERSPGMASPRKCDLREQVEALEQRVDRLGNAFDQAEGEYRQLDRTLGAGARAEAEQAELRHREAKAEKSKRKADEQAAGLDLLRARHAEAVRAAEAARDRIADEELAAAGFGDARPSEAPAVDPERHVQRAQALAAAIARAEQQHAMAVAEHQVDAAAVDETRQALRVQIAYQAELVHAEALAEYARMFSAYRRAHGAAFGSFPPPPNVVALAEVHEQAGEQEAAGDSEPTRGGLLSRLFTW